MQNGNSLAAAGEAPDVKAAAHTISAHIAPRTANSFDPLV
jgi:hypothetical protein